MLEFERKEALAFTLEEIREVKDEVEADLFELPGVMGVDIGPKYVDGVETDVLAIRIYVQRKEAVPEEYVIPAFIQGIPTDVVERSFGLHSPPGNTASTAP
jgi:hypothetical protein